jgi:GNAT superfamily N-acetyltransferase
MSDTKLLCCGRSATLLHRPWTPTACGTWLQRDIVFAFCSVRVSIEPGQLCGESTVKWLLRASKLVFSSHRLFGFPPGPDAEAQGAASGLPDILAVVHMAPVTTPPLPSLAGHAGMAIRHVATHPDVRRMGYGSRCLQLVLSFLRGEMALSGSVKEAAGDAAETQVGSRSGSPGRSSDWTILVW